MIAGADWWHIRCAVEYAQVQGLVVEPEHKKEEFPVE
jgi:hypothetical protein